MRRFYGNHQGTRQDRGFRKVKPANHNERLASMERELANRIRIYGEGSFLVKMQRGIIAREIREGAGL